MVPGEIGVFFPPTSSSNTKNFFLEEIPQACGLWKDSHNEFPFGISLQTLCFLEMHFDMCPWSCDLSLCETLSLAEKVLEAFTAEIWSSNVMCLHKPHYWLQALMLICFSSSEGGRSNLCWATLNPAADLKDFLR